MITASTSLLAHQFAEVLVTLHVVTVALVLFDRVVEVPAVHVADAGEVDVLELLRGVVEVVRAPRAGADADHADVEFAVGLGRLVVLAGTNVSREHVACVPRGQSSRDHARDRPGHKTPAREISAVLHERKP